MPKRIFIVDDSKVVRQLLRTHLENALKNSICSEAADGLDAVERVLDLAPDLIVLDFCMPRMNGLEAAGIIHGMLPEVPIILYTLHTEIVPRAVAKAAGIRAVISKAEPMDVLLGEIRSVTNVRRAASA
jgi:CheY-like chemotaxis protein